MHIPIAGYRTVVENLIRLHEVGGEALGPDRALNLPRSTSRRGRWPRPSDVADRPLGAIRSEIDPIISSFFQGWAQHSSFGRATALGLADDETVRAVVTAYIQDFLEPAGARR